MTSIALLVHQYHAAASQHRQATERGDASTANQKHAQLMRAYRTLKRQGEAAVAQLVPLLDNHDPAVASWAATHLLPSHEQQARAALQRISQLSGVVALGATMVLQEWVNGRLRID
ncbi:DUF2019 domain-containing protein [Hymenobacter guriensis]|uniref:DUF2019 domain-containing protein n=1 Tax=Hymenobacter guriensis TaxID=2793065 RepID=A0ABS0L7M3_9BACT|nr:DUF2019 domain-containing protein [Hymenobacter guriensis]MBG8556107.1 DUF2019 domain-containing protein [Hymenobacter guriensis]